MRNDFVSLLCLAFTLGCGAETEPGHADDGGVGGGLAGETAAPAGSAGSAAGTAGNDAGSAGSAAGTAGNDAGGRSSSAGRGGGPASGTGGGGAPAGSGGTVASSGAGAEAGAAGLGPEPGPRGAERAALDAELASLSDLNATTLRERYPTTFAAAPTYEASEIAGLDLIQASALALTDAEQAALLEKGFVISATRAFPTFTYGYASVYGEDLPVYISADSILTSVHSSFDAVLKMIESNALIPELTTLLDGMRARLEGGVGAELGAQARADGDVFLAVAASLLAGETLPPVAGGSADVIRSLVEQAEAASGTANVELFGELRAYEDFSQFKPRGHYTDSSELGRYFKAMMWLGRIDFRLLETQPDGGRVFKRRQLDGTLLMSALIDSELRPHFDNIDNAVRVFVGEPDYMELSEVDALLSDVGAASLAATPPISDQAFEQAIVAAGYGAQRISSHVMLNGLDAPSTLPLSLSFALLGQRYVVDSHVFSNVVYDRAGGGDVLRMLPNPLDVAFAALGNDQAAALLTPELERYAYAPDLASMRLLADKHPPEFWSGSLYNLWLASLRELGPAAIAGSENAAALPPTFRTEAWGRRLLQTQLASWAELRHGTLLYAKQSYSSGSQCEFPDGYVDPYPEFYARIAEYAASGKTLVGSLLGTSSAGTLVGSYFDTLLATATRLHDMAVHQRTGAPYTEDMLEFLNQAVSVTDGCGGPFPGGWYARLFFNVPDALAWAPTIADVHTQPFDEGGSPVGRVLHVGTGDARLMIVVAETCSGPRAYAGLASSYQEHITSNYERLDDPTWEEIVRDQPDVPWAADLVVH